MEEFRLATPEFLAACRWVVMAEKMVPGYLEAEAIQHAPLTPDNALNKLQARDQLEAWGAWLFPEDDDG